MSEFTQAPLTVFVRLSQHLLLPSGGQVVGLVIVASESFDNGCGGLVIDGIAEEIPSQPLMIAANAAPPPRMNELPIASAPAGTHALLSLEEIDAQRLRRIFDDMAHRSAEQMALNLSTSPGKKTGNGAALCKATAEQDQRNLRLTQAMTGARPRRNVHVFSGKSSGARPRNG